MEATGVSQNPRKQRYLNSSPAREEYSARILLGGGEQGSRGASARS
jgi:hypothetical protein